MVELFWFFALSFLGLLAIYIPLSKSVRNKTILKGNEETERILRRLSVELPIDFHVDFQLRNGEEVVWVDKNVELIESRRAPRVTRRTTDAFTVALAKGFYYTAASGTSISPEPGDEIRRIDIGRVTYTTMRVLYTGEHYSREWDMAKVIGWNQDIGGKLMIATTNRKRLSGVSMRNPTVGLAPSLAFQIAGIAAESGWEAARRQCERALEATQNQREIVQNNPFVSTEKLQQLIEEREESRLAQLDEEPDTAVNQSERPSSQRVPIESIEIVGQVFQAKSFAALHEKFGETDGGEFTVEAQLVCEPENQHSPSGKAVAVYVRNLKLGYVPEWLAARVFDAVESIGNDVYLGGVLRLAGSTAHAGLNSLTLRVDSRLPLN